MMRSLLISLIMLSVSTGALAQIYRWVDENGKVHYGDKIPAKYAKTTTNQLNKQGITVDVKERQKTPEEIAAEAEAKKEAERQRQRDAEQARFDQFLLSNYPNPGSLERARDERLAIMDGQIEIAKKSRVDAEKQLAAMEQRAENFRQQERPVPDKLSRQIVEYKGQMDESARRLAKLEADRAERAREFEEFRERLAVLRPGEP